MNKSSWLKTLTVWLLALAAALPLAAAADYEGNFPLAEGAGVVQELDFAAQSMVIDGLRYQVAVDAKVEIGGSYGAFTMLQPGMRVQFEFLRISDKARRIVLVRELAPDATLEEV